MQIVRPRGSARWNQLAHQTVACVDEDLVQRTCGKVAEVECARCSCVDFLWNFDSAWHMNFMATDSYPAHQQNHNMNTTSLPIWHECCCRVLRWHFIQPKPHSGNTPMDEHIPLCDFSHAFEPTGLLKLCSCLWTSRCAREAASA
jgi:hypothetical protein